jgi:hypothetical protein
MIVAEYSVICTKKQSDAIKSVCLDSLILGLWFFAEFESFLLA